MAKKTLEDPTMKKTGAMILSFILIFMMTVTNLAGAYHSAAQVYAAEETDGGEDNADGGTQGGDETGLTDDAVPTGDALQSVDQDTTITPSQDLNQAPQTQVDTQQQDVNPAPQDDSTQLDATTAVFTVTFDANGHGTAPAAVTVESGQTIAKPAAPEAEGFTFTGWFRDANATVEWNFDTDTVNENITLYAGWTENPPAPTLQSNAENTSSTQGDANTENNNAQEGATTSNAGNTASTAQEGTTTSDAGSTSTTQDEMTPSNAGNTGSMTQEDIASYNTGNPAPTSQENTQPSDAGNIASTAQDDTQTSDAGNTASAEQEDTKPANDKNEEDNNKTTFTVTFDVNGHGTAPASVTVEEGDTIPAPDAPEADGFIFTGWYTEPEARNIWNFEKDTVTGNLTLYAEWQEASRKDEDDPPASFPAFSQSTTVNGITVSAKAEEGAFPEGARLSVLAVYGSAQAQAEQKVEAARSDDTNVTASHTLDIKVLDETGKELQPADGHEVVLSFSSAQIADDNTEVSVYHIEGNHAEELSVSTQGNTATTVTGGFSYYVVQYSTDLNDLYWRVDYLYGRSVGSLLRTLGFEAYDNWIMNVVSSHPDIVRVYQFNNRAWYYQWTGAPVPNGVTLTITVTDNRNITTNYTVKVEQAQPNTSGTINDVRWSFYKGVNGDGVLVIDGDLNGNINYAPWFAFRSEIHEVVFEEGTTVVHGTSLTQCNNLMYVQLPSTLKSFYGSKFDNCASLSYFHYSGTVDDWKKVDGYSNRLPDRMYVQCTDGTYSNSYNDVVLDVKGKTTGSNDSAEILGATTGVLFGETVTVKVTTDLLEVESVIVKYPSGSTETLIRDSIEGGSEVYRFTMGRATATVEVTFKSSEKHKITVATQGKGTASIKDAVTYDQDYTRAWAGMPLVVIANPDEGYRLSGCTVTNLSDNTIISTDENSLYMFRMPDAPVRVDVTFVPQMFNVTVHYDETKGAVTKPGRTKADDTVSFQVTPHSGYGIEAITYTWNGNTKTIPVVAGQQWYSFIMPPADVELNVTFKKTPDAPKITTTSLPDAYVGEAYNFTVTAEGKGDITWSASNLPDGLSINAQGVISGTPVSNYFSGNPYASNLSKTVTLTATSNYGSDMKIIDITITIHDTITVSVEPAGAGDVTGAGVYRHQDRAELNAIPNEGYHFLGWYDAADELLGTNLSLSRNASGSVTYTAKFQKTEDGTPEIITTYLPHAYKNVSYEQILEAKGETPMTWELVEGSLPDGLSFFSDGKISGTLTEEPVGSSRIFVKVSNKKGTDIREYWLAYGDNTIRVYYNVVNGKWSDGSTERKEERVPIYTHPAHVPTGMQPNPGYGSGVWNVDPTETVINGTSFFTYTFIQQYQPSGDATLLSLAGTGFSSAGEPDQSLALSPAFAPGTTSYTAQVDHAYDSVLIDAETTHYKATIGGDIGAQSLAVGDNTFVITVTAEDKTTKDYTITITRKAPATSITITLTNNDATTQAPGWVTGDKGTATAVVSPAGALQDVTWSSSNEDAVKIDQNGNIEVVYDSPTNMSPYVMITAEAKDGSRVTATERIEVFSHCHTVRFHPEGGGGSMGSYGSNDIVVYDSGRSKEYKLPDCRFTPPGGKRFKAWRVNGTEYQPDRTITLSGRCSKTDVYAVWEDFTPRVYKITVQTDGNGTAEARKTAVPSGYETVQSALQGTNIYPRVTPNNGYGIATATYSYHDGTTLKEISLINPMMAGLESFTMPAADVTIKVTFVPGGPRLTDLSVSPGTLTPVFDKDILSYDVTVAHDVSEIEATVTYPEGTNVENGTWTSKSEDVTNRRKTFSHTLYYGINKLHLSVYETASGSGTDYYLNVTREPAPGAPKITTASLPDGEERKLYTTTTLTADNAENAIWSLGGGDLPVGLSLSPDGKISGTPTQAGTYSFIVKAEKNGLYDRKELTITINPAPVPAQAYTITLDANGGTVNGNSTYTATTGTDGKLTSLPTPTHTNTNMQFIGWFTASTGGTQVNTSTVFKSNSTIYAQWKDNTPATRMRTVLGGLTGGVPGTKYDTKEKVEDELLYRVGLSRTTANGRWVAYDVKLQVYVNGLWVDATPANFPAGGLTVILPYPSGTGRDTHTFKVAHMFTMTMPGKTHKPGDVETPPVTKTANGIQVTLTGLSPVLVSWTEVNNSNPSNPSNPSGPTNPSGGNGGSGGGTSTGGNSTQDGTQSTVTGGLTASGGTNAFATNTGTTTTRTSAGANETNARMAQTGDDFYERLGIHTLLFLAALTTLLASLRKLNERRRAQ